MVPLIPVPRPHFAVRAASVTKVFGDTIALWDVSVDCGAGGLLAIHGANGSGKSTLVRIIAGLTSPTRGRISWTSDSPGRRPRLGLLGHASHLFDELTAIENVTLAARLAGRDESIAIGLLGRLGVDSRGARLARDLSAGTRRRVGLARALATDADALLVDEPFAGLDEEAGDLVGRVLAEARDDGRVVVVATHDDSRTRSMATHTVWLEAGRIRDPRLTATEAVAT